MKAKFIIGRAGAGKTSYCLDEIVSNIQGGCTRPLLLLVPNQFSLEMEKKLVQKTGGKGMDAAQVLSFERFSYRVFSLYGKPDKKTLDEMGKSALLRKILYENRDKLKYYGGSHGKEGFVNQISGLFTEFYKYGIDAKRLADIGCGGDVQNTALSSKISDLSFILQEFSDYIKDEYITFEQNLDLLAEALPGAVFFHGAKIWLDGFYRFTEQDYRVIGKLCEICDEMTATLTIPEAEFPDGSFLSQYDPFFETKATAMRLNNIFGAHGTAGVVRLVKKIEYGYSEQLSHLDKQYFYFTPQTSLGADSVFITGTGSVYDEAEAAASEIASLVRGGGLRYKEIAVCACDLEAYGHVLRDCFNKYCIPYFIDMSRPVYGKRLVEAIRSLIEIGVTNWSADSVMRLLRTRLTDFSDSEADILENYILEYGIKGYKWKTVWKGGEKSGRYDIEALNEKRQRLYKAVSSFLKLFENKKTPSVKEASAAIFDFIEKNGIKERLLLIEGNKRETAQIWNIVVSVFDKLVEILSDEKADIRTFSQIVEGALQGVTEGFIPQTADMVILGDIKRTRLPEIKALFVLGMNDGVIPSSKGAEGILSDADRLLLAEQGAALAPSGVRQTVSEQFLVYSALTKPKERLYVSWPATGFDGGELQKSIIIEKLETIFPNARKLSSKAEDAALCSKKAFLSEIAVKAGELKTVGRVDGIWAEGLKWLGETEYSDVIERGLSASRRVVRLPEEAAEKLVKKDIYSSVTRIEKYIKCPFSYFAEYGLKASERRIYGLNPMDIGNVYHSALDSLCKEMEARGLKWGTLQDVDADSLVDVSIEEACSGIDVFESSEKNKYLVSRIKRITKRAVWALDYHIRSGSFTPYEYETGFGTGDGLLPPIVIELNEGHRLVFSGRVDRVDIYDKDGTRYIKIIDYKSGSRKLDLQEVYYGLQLQLILYLDAYLKSGENLLPAGVFYFRVTDPLISEPEDAGESGDSVADGILNSLRLTGLVVNDADIIDALHNNLNGASNVIPVKLKKPGKKDVAPVPDAYSSVATMEQFYMLMKRTTDIIREAGNRLVSGDIEPRPVKGVGTAPCMYCAYGTLCGFDVNGGYRYRSLKKLKNSEVLELLEDRDGQEQNN